MNCGCGYCGSGYGSCGWQQPWQYYEQPPLDQLCCLYNCSRNQPTQQNTTQTQTPTTREGPTESVKKKKTVKQPVQQPVAVVNDEPQIELEEDVFVESMDDVVDIANADFEEDPILPHTNTNSNTPVTAYKSMTSTGPSQAPLGAPIPWDGKPLPFRGKSKGQLCEMFYPEKNSNLVGLHDLYDRLKPFRNELSPTPAEIDKWNMEVLRHFRRLIGNTAPFNVDQNLFIQSRWADERKFSKQWDAAYPGSNKGGTGPCPAGSGAHCGWRFLPNCMDQQPYLEQFPGRECITRPSDHSEGMTNVPNSVPWANKIAAVLKAFLCQDGTQAHMGPVFGNIGPGPTYSSGRSTVGISFWDKGNGNSSVRIKWGKKV